MTLEAAPAWSSGTDILPDEALLRRRRPGLRRGAVPAQRQAPQEELKQLDRHPVASVMEAERQEPPAPRVPQSRDRLTGLLNRDGFLQLLDGALPPVQPLAVVSLGLDNFRHLNASLGAEDGDLALVRAAQVLASALAPHPVARVAGDCFAVLIPFDGAPSALAQVRKVLDHLKDADLSSTGSGIRLTASAGVTILDRPGLTAADCLQEADLAMSTAKAEGRDRTQVHHALSMTSATAMLEWAARIRSALATDALAVHAQPVRSLLGEAEQWELLVRLPVGDGQLLPPAQLLPVAQRFGLMQQVDEWVTRTAIRFIGEAAQRGQVLRLEVNVAEQSVASIAFTEMVETEVRASGIEPSSLVFEVNGTVASTSPDDVRVFTQRLHDLGCLFALDNFGSHSGALEQLKALPLDFVKIDGSFVRHLASSAKDQLIVRSLTDLAHAMGCKVIATAVSDEPSRELLARMGVDYVQGFHIGRPQPVTEVTS